MPIGLYGRDLTANPWANACVLAGAITLLAGIRVLVARMTKRRVVAFGELVVSLSAIPGNRRRSALELPRLWRSGPRLPPQLRR